MEFLEKAGQKIVEMTDEISGRGGVSKLACIAALSSNSCAILARLHVCKQIYEFRYRGVFLNRLELLRGPITVIYLEGARLLTATED